MKHVTTEHRIPLRSKLNHKWRVCWLSHPSAKFHPIGVTISERIHTYLSVLIDRQRCERKEARL